MASLTFDLHFLLARKARVSVIETGYSATSICRASSARTAMSRPDTYENNWPGHCRNFAFSPSTSTWLRDRKLTGSASRTIPLEKNVLAMPDRDSQLCRVLTPSSCHSAFGRSIQSTRFLWQGTWTASTSLHWLHTSRGKRAGGY